VDVGGKDPDELQAQGMKCARTSATDWKTDVEGEPRVVGPRYVVVEQIEYLGMIRPTLVVVIFKDESLERTAIVVPRPPPPIVLPP